MNHADNVVYIQTYFDNNFTLLHILYYFPCYQFRFIAESARWLISRGEHEKAEKIIRRVAQVNKRELPDVLFEPEEIKALKVIRKYY